MRNTVVNGDSQSQWETSHSG